MPDVLPEAASRAHHISAHSQLAQFGPIIDTLLDDVFCGDHPLLPRDQEAAFMSAVLDEVGRGTHPCDLKKRLIDCLADQENTFRHAA